MNMKTTLASLVVMAAMASGCGGEMSAERVDELGDGYQWSLSAPDGDGMSSMTLGDGALTIDVSGNALTIGATEVNSDGIESRSAYLADRGAPIVTVACQQETSFHLVGSDGDVAAVTLRCY